MSINNCYLYEKRIELLFSEINQNPKQRVLKLKSEFLKVILAYESSGKSQGLNC